MVAAASSKGGSRSPKPLAHAHHHAHHKETSTSTSSATSKKRGATRKRLAALGVYSDEKIEAALAQYDNFHDCYGFLLMLEQREFEKGAPLVCYCSYTRVLWSKNSAASLSKAPVRVSI